MIAARPASEQGAWRSSGTLMEGEWGSGWRTRGCRWGGEIPALEGGRPVCEPWLLSYLFI